MLNGRLNMVSRHEIVTLVRTDRKRQAASRIFVNQTSIGYNLCGQASQFHVYVHIEISPCVANVRTNQQPRLSA